jgi:hypothetical protein
MSTARLPRPTPDQPVRSPQRPETPKLGPRSEPSFFVDAWHNVPPALALVSEQDDLALRPNARQFQPDKVDATSGGGP